MLFAIFWLLCAAFAAMFARDRGRSAAAWFFIGLACGVFGLAAVLSLRDLSKGTAPADAPAAGRAAAVVAAPGPPAPTRAQIAMIVGMAVAGFVLAAYVTH